MKILACFLMLNLGSLAALPASEIGELIEEIKQQPKGDRGISKDVQKLAERIQKIGAPAIPPLLDLLQDKNESIRDKAAYILSDMPGLTEKDLDALMASQRRDDSWLPRAIARIGTPQAIKFLVDELVRVRQDQNQLTYAMEVLGPKAVPDLVQVYHSDVRWDDKLKRTMHQVFKDLGPKAADAVAPLAQIAGDEKLSISQRVHALEALGAIGLAAEKAVPLLLSLAQARNKEIREASESAILDIGTKEAVPIWLRLLADETNPDDKADIISAFANLRERGVTAGPTLMKYLSDEHWHLRLAAASALGYLGYKPAAENLIPLLENKEDWRLVYCVARSLAYLQAQQALPALAKVSESHWYPPVRREAAETMQLIQENRQPAPGNAYNFYTAFFAYTEISEPSFSWEEIEKITPIFPRSTSQAALSSNQKEPGSTLKVEDGRLLATDRGEWGGEITFINSRGLSKVILKENTHDLYRTKDGIHAVTGLAHMSINEGCIYKLIRTKNGRWAAKRWRILPGAPTFSRVLEDGRLFVSCYGGIVVISPNGDMESLTKAKALALLKTEKLHPQP